MSGLPFFATLIAFLEATKYPLFFAGAYIEGTGVMLTGGVLLHLGDLQFWPLYVSLILGDVLSDIMWYWVGYFGARKIVMRWGYLVGATHEVLAKVERRFNIYHLRILVISKLTMGFGLAVPILMTAGMMRVSFIRYCVINIIGSFVWVAFIIFVGYNFGNVLSVFPEQYQILSFVVLIAAFFIAIRFLTKRLERVDW